MWYLQESNQGHKDFQSFALPTELRYRILKCDKYKMVFRLQQIIPNKNLLVFLIIVLNAIMNLVLDIGNTFSKYSVFDLDKIKHKGLWKSNDIVESFKKWIKENPRCKSIIISDVFGIETSILESMTESRIVWVSNKIKLPFKLKYKSPGSLGADRLSLLAATINKYPKKNSLIIDLGTCITYDFIDKSGNYLGGSISPGFSLRYKSFKSFTKKLPELEFQSSNKIMANSTEDCIHSGVYFGILGEVKHQISFYKEKYKNLTIILTGGDADKLANKIKNGIFANHNFLAEGLYKLLKLNTE